MPISRSGDKKVVNIVLTNKLHKQLQEEAEKKVISVSTLIRLILLEHFDKK